MNPTNLNTKSLGNNISFSCLNFVVVIIFINGIPLSIVN